MNARSGGVVAVGFVGLILFMFGALIVVVGLSGLFSTRQYELTLAATFQGTPIPPPATPLMVWIAATGVGLAILGTVIIRFRGGIVDRWLLLPEQTSEGEPPADGAGLLTAVGIAGLCVGVTGLGEVTAAAVGGLASGWNDEWTYPLWSGLPFLIVGVALVLRPRLLSYWWKS